MKKESQEILQLQEKIKKLEEQLEFKNQLVFVLNDSTPEAQTERKKYMGEIALFYGSIFKSKIQHFISLQMEELAQIGRTELGTNIIRSNINCFRIIDEWMEKCSNEHFGDLQEARNSFDENSKIINNIKKTYVDQTNK